MRAASASPSFRLATTAGYEAATAPRAASDLFGGTPPEAKAPVEVAENETSATAMAMAKNGFVIIEKKTQAERPLSACLDVLIDKRLLLYLQRTERTNKKHLERFKKACFFLSLSPTGKFNVAK